VNTTFTYADETDKSYGIAGMVISLNIAEADDALDYVSLDNDGESSFRLSQAYTSVMPQGASVSDTWHRMVSRYKLLMSLVLANVFCRRCVYRREAIDRPLISDVLALVSDEGHSYCSLDDDEIDHLYRRTANDMAQVFSNPKVHDIARRYARALMQRRHLSGSEAFELLQSFL